MCGDGRTSLHHSEVAAAGEIFGAGNTVKMRAVKDIDGCSPQPGPFRARELCWD